MTIAMLIPMPMRRARATLRPLALATVWRPLMMLPITLWMLVSIAAQAPLSVMFAIWTGWQWESKAVMMTSTVATAVSSAVVVMSWVVVKAGSVKLAMTVLVSSRDKSRRNTKDRRRLIMITLRNKTEKTHYRIVPRLHRLHQLQRLHRRALFPLALPRIPTPNT